MTKDEAVFQARCLVRGAASATLATSIEGQPFASLVTPAAAPDLSPLLWLSTLAEHTRHLAAEPRCALLFSGAAAEANPQTTPRVGLTGLAELVPPEEVPALKARWLARHPYAALYAGFADFALWRVRIGGALLVGGFARAQRLPATLLAPDAAAVARIAAAEADIVEHMNADHAGAVALLATRLLGGAEGEWRMLAVDTDGCDLGLGERVLRLAFAAPAADADGVKAALIEAIRRARAGAAVA
jgi:putative heme iron utilization protein